GRALGVRRWHPARGLRLASNFHGRAAVGGRAVAELARVVNSPAVGGSAGCDATGMTGPGTQHREREPTGHSQWHSATGRATTTFGTGSGSGHAAVTELAEVAKTPTVRRPAGGESAGVISAGC